MSRVKVLHFSSGTKWLHWLVAAIVLLLLAFSFFLQDLAKPIQPNAYMIHKSLGLTVLVLMVLRIIWITYKGRPELPRSVPRWEVIFSRAIQHCLYLFLILMPICGWITSVASNRIPRYFNLFNVPIPGLLPNKSVAEFFDVSHKTIAWILIILIFLHIAGALKHFLWDKDQVLERMLPGG